MAYPFPSSCGLVSRTSFPCISIQATSWKLISHILYMTKQVLFYQTKKQCFEQTERWSNSSADKYIEAPSQSSQTLISCILNETSNGWVLNLFGINKADTSPLQTKTSANLPAVGFNFSDGYRPQSNPPKPVRSRKTLRISRLHIQLYVWTRSHCSTKGHLSAQENQTCLWDTASPLLTFIKQPASIC